MRSNLHVVPDVDQIIELHAFCDIRIIQ
jgi:hypothetical protein